MKTGRLAGAIILCTLGVTGCGDPEIIIPGIMSVVALLPSHGTIDVATNTDILAYLSHPASEGASTTDALGIACTGAPPCSSPDVATCPSATLVLTTTYDATTQRIRGVLSVPLQAATCYEITVSAGVTALSDKIEALPVAITSSFQTR